VILVLMKFIQVHPNHFKYIQALKGSFFRQISLDDHLQVQLHHKWVFFVKLYESFISWDPKMYMYQEVNDNNPFWLTNVEGFLARNTFQVFYF
jgi:hypothetical protein